MVRFSVSSTSRGSGHRVQLGHAVVPSTAVRLVARRRRRVADARRRDAGRRRGRTHGRERSRQSSLREHSREARARGRGPLRSRRDRQASVAADDEPGGAQRSDSVRSRTVHSVRPRGSPARLPGDQHADRSQQVYARRPARRGKKDRIEDRSSVIMRPDDVRS
jgi:hypothetical protein